MKAGTGKFSFNFLLHILYVVIVSAGVLYFLTKQVGIWEGYGAPYSVADCMVTVNQPWIFAMLYLPLTVLLIHKNEEAYFMPTFILPYVQKRDLWRRQFLGLLRKTLLYSLFFSAVSVCASAYLSDTWINWGDRYSLFYNKTEMPFHYPYGVLLALFIYFLWWKTFFLSLLMTGEKWISRGQLFSCFAIVILTIIEWNYQDSNLFYRLFSIHYKNFSSFYLIYVVLVLSLVLLFGIYKVIYYSIEKRDIFYG